MSEDYEDIQYLEEAVNHYKNNEIVGDPGFQDYLKINEAKSRLNAEVAGKSDFEEYLEYEAAEKRLKHKSRKSKSKK